MDVKISKLERLAAVFRALGDPTRLRIYLTLRDCAREVRVDEAGQCRADGTLSVGEVCCGLPCAASTVSHHLKELRLAGLIRTEKRGRTICCSIEPGTLAAIQEFANEGEGEVCQETTVSELEACCSPPGEAELDLASISR
jgi:ArsR family transcriptional regulator, arsenate/arsenite/antimonite-responsive transcriptional repressor